MQRWLILIHVFNVQRSTFAFACLKFLIIVIRAPFCAKYCTICAGSVEFRFVCWKMFGRVSQRRTHTHTTRASNEYKANRKKLNKLFNVSWRKSSFFMGLISQCGCMIIITTRASSFHPVFFCNSWSWMALAGMTSCAPAYRDWKCNREKDPI